MSLLEITKQAMAQRIFIKNKMNYIADTDSRLIFVSTKQKMTGGSGE